MPHLRHNRPPVAAQKLLLEHLAAMRASFVRDLMRENGLTGLSNTKDVLLDIVESALRDGKLSWGTLIAFLDRHEPYGKQRVQMLRAPVAQRQRFAATTIKAALDAAGLGHIWGASVPLAAPDELELSSVELLGPVLHVVAVGRRTYRRRVGELEDQVELPREGLEVQLYEHVAVRAWIRAELDTRNGSLNVRAVSLPREKAQRELLDDFMALIAPWYPVDLFAPLDLGKAIKELHDDECSGTPCEALIQAVGYDDASGRKTSLRSASANQSVNGAPPAVQAAIDTFRANGAGSDGNFYFLPTAQGGPPGVPIGDEPVRVVVKAAAGRLDFTKPLDRAELEHVLRRIRVLAT